MSNNQKIVITVDGKTTAAKLYDGKKLIKSVEARCHPDDVFNFITGAEIAFDRLIEDFKVKPKEMLKNGVFGLTADNDWFVVVGEILVYQRGWFDTFKELSDDLHEIVVLVNATSFFNAQYRFKEKPQEVIWRNPRWIK